MFMYELVRTYLRFIIKRKATRATATVALEKMYISSEEKVGSYIVRTIAK